MTCALSGVVVPRLSNKIWTQKYLKISKSARPYMPLVTRVLPTTESKESGILGDPSLG